MSADSPMDGFGFRGLGDLGRTGSGLLDAFTLSQADIQIDETRKSAKISFNPTESIVDMSRSQGTPRTNPTYSFC